MKYLVICAFVAAVGCGPRNNNSQSSPLSLTDAQFVTQDMVGVNTCGPTALFYALKTGNPAMQAAYSFILKGNNDQEKLKYLIDSYTIKPSQIKPAVNRLNPDGMYPADLAETSNDIARDLAKRYGLFFQLNTISLERNNNESRPGDFTERVYSKIKASLNSRVPVIAMISDFYSVFDREQKKFLWNRGFSHFVIISKVPESISPRQLGFPVHFVNPWSGREEVGFLYENVSFNLYGISLAGTWASNTVNYNNEDINSPFLVFVSPTLYIESGDPQKYNRNVSILTSAVGSFN